MICKLTAFALVEKSTDSMAQNKTETQAEKKDIKICPNALPYML